MNRSQTRATRLNRPGSGRRFVILALLAIAVVLLFGRFVANFMIDRWWYLGLGRSDVFWGRLFAQATMFGIAYVLFVGLAALNLYIADRSAPLLFSANVHPLVERFHELFGRRLRSLRYGAAAIFGLLVAAPAAARWQDWMLFRHGGSFGSKDAQFGHDVGFYIFRLPLVAFVVDWWFAAVFVVVLLTVVAHLLNGGLVVTNAMPTLRRATTNHLAVLLGLLAAIKSADYIVSRYELVYSRQGFIDGATYTLVHARLPALLLLCLVALLTAGLYLAVLRSGRWRPAIIASALWLVVAILGIGVYPSLVESFVVRPNQPEREAPFIVRNVTATRTAYGLDSVVTREVEFEPLTTADVESDLVAFHNVRLLDDELMLNQFEIDRGEKAGLQITDLDVDRYPSGEGTDPVTQVMIAARELDLGGVPNTSWPSLHLVNTRGCGLVSAPLGKVTDTDRPVYTSVPLQREQLYFSSRIGGFAIVGTDATENPCGEAGPYQGEAGVRLGGFGRRFAFALAFADYNLVASRGITADSQILWHRSVRDRIERIAPFLQLDNDPYPVVVDGGVKWVLDAYTSTPNYPYSQSIGDVKLTSSVDISPDSNYLRNSVKAVVDAYTGAVDLYVIDTADPILTAWRRAFPNLFTSLDEMPTELRSHLRYPEDLFTIQTELYSKYHLPPEDFFERTGAWSVAQAPSVDRQDAPVLQPSSTLVGEASRSDSFAAETDVKRFVPYYTLFPNGAPADDAPGSDDAAGAADIADEEDFVIFRPFVPFSRDDRRTELQAYMTASSDPDNYGQLTSYVVTNNPKVPGPLRVADQAENDEAISKELTLQYNTDSGTKVKFGDIQATPVADGLVYVRPVYVISGESTKISFVIVSNDNATVMTKGLDAALAKLFPGYEGTIGDRVNTQAGGLATSEDPNGTETEGSAETGGTSEPGGTEELATINDLLAAAAAAYDEAQRLLADGDLGGYQAKMDEVGRLVLEAEKLINGDATTTVPGSTPASAGTNESTTGSTADGASDDGTAANTVASGTTSGR